MIPPMTVRKQRYKLNKKRKKMDYAVPNSKKEWKLSSYSESPHQDLPHEVIVCNILSRLPIYKLVKECALFALEKAKFEKVLHFLL
ncbi:hypothetical protein MKX03_023639 [Papaver bracteatum]|nr:hypothetical protein MKX03_023639 [Papaver bracteatum]